MKRNINLVLVLSACSILMFLFGCEEKTATAKPVAQAVQSEQVQTEQDVPSKAQQQVEKTDTAQAAAPKIVFEKDTFDFGNIDPGSKNLAEFHFTNKGNGTLKITKVQSTCGCSRPELKKRTYEPGESGTIKVTYTASQRSGLVRKTLYVLSNDPQNPKEPFYLKAEIVKKVSYEPKQLKLRFDKENAGAEEIKIEGLDNRKFAISRIAVKPDCMSFDYDPAAEGTSFTLAPKVNMDKLKNVKNGVINLYLTHPSQKTISVAFNVLAPYKTDPATLIALNAEPGASVRKVVYVLSNYGEDFDIESVKAENDDIKIVSQEKKQDKYVITLDIIAPEQTGAKRYFNSKLNIKIKDGQTLIIPCVGSIKKKS